MNKWTSEEVRAMSDSMAIYWSRCESRFASVAMLTAYAERIASDEAAVPVAFALRHESGQLVGLAFKKLGNGNGFTEVPLFTHPPAQPPIDLAAIREVIVELRGWDNRYHGLHKLADKLSRAIGDTP